MGVSENKGPKYIVPQIVGSLFSRTPRYGTFGNSHMIAKVASFLCKCLGWCCRAAELLPKRRTPPGLLAWAWGIGVLGLRVLSPRGQWTFERHDVLLPLTGMGCDCGSSDLPGGSAQ